jgi:urea carboxylase system permease
VKVPTPSAVLAARDDEDLQSLGYTSQLKRKLGQSATFAAGFALISVLVGTSVTYGIGWSSAGPAAVWLVLVVFFGQLMTTLVFAELAAKYPISGSIYQWAKRIGGDFLGWMTGWVYTVAWLIVAPTIALGLQATLTALSPRFQLFGSDVVAATDPLYAANAAFLSLFLFAATTAVNVMKVSVLRLLSYIGVFAELAGVALLLVVLMSHVRRGPSVLAHGIDVTAGGTQAVGGLLIAAFLPLYVLFGMDEATSLAEETRDPRRNGPRAMLKALGVAGGLCFLIVALVPMAIPDLTDPHIGDGLSYVVNLLAGPVVGKVFSLVVLTCIVCAATAAHALVARMIFSQARDGRYWAATKLSRVSHSGHTPIWATLLVAVLWFTALLINIAMPRVFSAIIGAGTFLIYLGYLAVSALALRSRLRGDWSTQPGHFSLGRWGLYIDAAAVLFGVLACANMMWPRAAFYGSEWWQRYAGMYVPVVVIGVGLIHYLAAGKRNRDVIPGSPTTSSQPTGPADWAAASPVSGAIRFRRRD